LVDICKTRQRRTRTCSFINNLGCMLDLARYVEI
jgi:hypothetical protein